MAALDEAGVGEDRRVVHVEPVRVVPGCLAARDDLVLIRPDSGVGTSALGVFPAPRGLLARGEWRLA
jgi:hypothetical protein